MEQNSAKYYITGIQTARYYEQMRSYLDMAEWAFTNGRIKHDDLQLIWSTYRDAPPSECYFNKGVYKK